jgi:nucleoside-diphosphate-sugar epimerase
VLNIGGGEEATMTRVISLLERASGQTVPVEMADAQQGDVRRTGADTTRARRRLGWAPQVGLVEGLASELDWVRARHGLPHLAAALRTAPFARLQARAS